MFNEYLEKNNLTLEYFGITAPNRGKATANDDEEEEEELMECDIDHEDWKNYNKETIPSWCAPNSYFGGVACAKCAKNSLIR
jgi:hypothetical protein